MPSCPQRSRLRGGRGNGRRVCVTRPPRLPREMFTPWNALNYSTGVFGFLFNWGNLRTFYSLVDCLICVNLRNLWMVLEILYFYHFMMKYQQGNPCLFLLTDIVD